MDGGDPDTALAYYMFVNHGWRPSVVSELPARELILLELFMLKEIEARKNPDGGG